MATIVNTPAQGHTHEDTGANAGMNFAVGAIILLVVAFLLFYFGLPLLRNVGVPAQPAQINTNNPPQVNIPDKVNVDVNAPK
jgi:cytochrome c-type biogenesis protein CcmH/NrfG